MSSEALRTLPERRVLVNALRSLRKGDFTVRLEEEGATVDREIAMLFNEVVVLEEQMMKASDTQMNYNTMLNLYASNMEMIRTSIGRKN